MSQSQPLGLAGNYIRHHSPAAQKHHTLHHKEVAKALTRSLPVCGHSLRHICCLLYKHRRKASLDRNKLTAQPKPKGQAHQLD